MTIWVSMASWFTPASLFLLLNLVVATIFIISRFSASRNHHPVQLAQAPSLIDRVKSINFSLYKFPPPDSQPHFVPLSEAESTHPPPLVRAPSLLDRVKSINFFNYNIPQYNQETEFIQPSEPVVDPPPLARALSLLERVKSINLSSFHRSERPEPEGKFQPETEPREDYTDPGTCQETDGNPRRRKSGTGAAEKMKKSASEKSRLGQSSEEEDADMVERRRPTTMRVDRSSWSVEEDHGVDAKADDFINRFKQQLKLQRLDSILRYKEMLKGK